MSDEKTTNSVEGAIVVDLNDHDSRQEFMEMLKIYKYQSLLNDIYTCCRNIIKYPPPNTHDKTIAFAEQIRELINTSEIELY